MPFSFQTKMVRESPRGYLHTLLRCKHFKTVVDNLMNNRKYCYIHNSYTHNYDRCNTLNKRCTKCNNYPTEGNCPCEMGMIRICLNTQRNAKRGLQKLDSSFISNNSNDYVLDNRNQISNFSKELTLKEVPTDNLKDQIKSKQIFNVIYCPKEKTDPPDSKK